MLVDVPSPRTRSSRSPLARLIGAPAGTAKPSKHPPLPEIQPGEQRPRLTLRQPGRTATDPVLCGDPDGLPPRLVTATGLINDIRAGQTRWVTGTDVDRYVDAGLFVIVLDAPPEVIVRPTVLPDGAPGSDPELLGPIDLWIEGFTPCTMCDTGTAAPGTQVCEECTVHADETPLQRALRTAGS